MNDLGGLKGLLDAAQRLQSEMGRVKDELGKKTVSAETGGGLVKCVASGRGDLVSLDIDPSIVKETDRALLQDLVVGAVNLALDRARQLAHEEMARVTGGLPLPPGILGS